MDKALQVLVVEDQPDSASCLARLLRMNGHEVVIASSGGEALRNAREQSFDLALCDIGLPDIDGCDLFAQLRLLQPLKGIALTGYGLQTDVERFYAAGFVGHLVKPYPLDAVILAMQEAMAD